MRVRFFDPEAGGVFDPENPVANPVGTPRVEWTVSFDAVEETLSMARASGGVWTYASTAAGMELREPGGVRRIGKSWDEGLLVEVRETEDPEFGLLSRERRKWRNEDGALVLVEESQLDATSAVLASKVEVNGVMQHSRNGLLLFSESRTESATGYSVTRDFAAGGTELTSEQRTDLVDLERRVWNAAGNPVRTEYPDATYAEREWSATGELIRERDPVGVVRLHAGGEDASGNWRVSATDVDRDGVIDYAGTDRIARTTRKYVERIESGAPLTVERTTVEVWATNNQDTPESVQIEERTLDGLRSWSKRHNLESVSETAVGADGTRTDTTVDPTGRTRIVVSLAGVQLSSQVGVGAELLRSETQVYDNWWRLSSTTVVGQGTTTYTYHADDQIHTILTPDPDPTRSGTGYDPQLTTHHYDAVTGRLNRIVRPDGGEVHYAYHPDGKLHRTWGKGTYPQAYSYDLQGRIKTLTTWQGFAGNFATASGAATTKWNYDPERGWLLEKKYEDGTKTRYTYHADGKLQTRTWQREPMSLPLVTTYTYNASGELSSVGYSGTTPGAAYTYDRLGRAETRSDAAGVVTFGYQGLSGFVSSESYSGSGLLAGLSVERVADSVLRMGEVSGTGVEPVIYGYDARGRLESVDSGVLSATYGYGDSVHRERWTTLERRSGTQPVIATTRVLDLHGRLAAVTTAVGQTQGHGSSYGYNAANQRLTDTRANGSVWTYGYDDLDQVTSGVLAPATGVPGLSDYPSSRLYQFDTIGNRIQTTTDGRIAAWSADLLNQLDKRDVPSGITVRGTAAAGANVLVDGALATRNGERWSRDLVLDNAAANVRKEIAVVAALPAGGANGEDLMAKETRTVELPKTREKFEYDLDGNLEADGRWTYTWDAENRLIAVEPSPASVAAGTRRERVQFEYDGLSRRIRRTVSLWGGQSWALVSDIRYLYDGWNPVAEYIPAEGGLRAIRSYVWGLDLSESAQGAGGVGGLLATRVHAIRTWTEEIEGVTETMSATLTGGEFILADLPVLSYAEAAALGLSFPAYDGNGNILAYLSPVDGTPVATQTYAAFGETLTRTGWDERVLPHRFSTKPEERFGGLNYYGYRFYSAELGRWPNRDPIGERGGLNLCGIVGNNPVDKLDYLGKTASLSPIDNGAGPGVDTGGEVIGPPIGLTMLDLGLKVCDSYPDATDCDCCTTGNRVRDVYPGKARTVCRSFISKYQASRAVVGTAICLVQAEYRCNQYETCAERAACRLAAHFSCYAQQFFIPYFGLDAAEREVGWNVVLGKILEDVPCYLKRE